MRSSPITSWLAAVAATSFFSAAAFAAPPETTGSFSVNTGMIDGKPRSFVLYIPRDLRPGAPLLFMFHGGGGRRPIAPGGTGPQVYSLTGCHPSVVFSPPHLSP